MNRSGADPHNEVELDAFLADVRATYLRGVDEAVASRYLDAIRREAEAILEGPEPEPDWWRKSITNRFVRSDGTP